MPYERPRGLRTTTSKLLGPIAGISAVCLAAAPSAAQITVLDSFNPSEVGGLCSAGYDPDAGELWVYDCSASEVHKYAADGTFLTSVPRPGESANDVELEVAPEELSLAGTSVPAGTLMFINGESGVAEIYALDPSDGTVLATLVTAFGVSHVVGGAYHPTRDTFFLLQDNVPSSADENRVAEIDPATGAVLSTFQTTGTFDVFFGDIEVSTRTGNLFLVSSSESSIGEFTPDGSFVQSHPLPGGVSSLSGIALDCGAREAWVAGTGGTVWRLGDVPCSVGTKYCTATPNSTGEPADIDAFGSASSAAGDLTLVAAPVPNHPGIFFHAANQTQVSFGNGFLCASSGIVRGSIVIPTDFSGSYTYDNSDQKHDISAFIGTTRHFQYWYRDPAGGGAFFNTSDGISIDILP